MQVPDNKKFAIVNIGPGKGNHKATKTTGPEKDITRKNKETLGTTRTNSRKRRETQRNTRKHEETLGKQLTLAKSTLVHVVDWSAG